MSVHVRYPDELNDKGNQSQTLPAYPCAAAAAVSVCMQSNPDSNSRGNGISLQCTGNSNGAGARRGHVSDPDPDPRPTQFRRGSAPEARTWRALVVSCTHRRIAFAFALRGWWPRSCLCLLLQNAGPTSCSAQPSWMHEIPSSLCLNPPAMPQALLNLEKLLSVLWVTTIANKSKRNFFSFFLPNWLFYLLWCLYVWDG